MIVMRAAHRKRAEIFKTENMVRRSVQKLRELLVGQHVRILSDYNGQLYGTSKKPLTGQEHEISDVTISYWKDGTVNLYLKGLRISLDPDEVEFL